VPNDFVFDTLQRPRLAWLFRGLALLLLASSVFVTPFGGTPGAGAAGSRPHSAAAHRSTAILPGTIAYTRNYSELHLVQPDATNDHVIWSEPPGPVSSLLQSSWRPDSAEIAFASTHEQVASLYASDIFGVRPDGTGFRRISNPPDVSQLGGYPTGTVNVTISNGDIAGGGPYFVYMEGAPAAQETTVFPGTSVTLTFTNVAILPNATQYPVVISGLSRWLYPPSGVTVQPGTTVSSQVYIYSNTNYESFGASNPVWRTDGAQIDFALGSFCLGSSLPTYPSAGAFITLLLAPPASGSMCTFDRGPTPALANQILYWDNLNINGAGFYQVTEGSSTTAGTLVLPIDSANFVYGMRWLPDGSGFIYSQTSGYSTSDIFEYDFNSQAPRQLTNFAGNQNEYAGYLTLSPDGSTIVFEYATVDPNPVLNPNALPDLWIMPRDGSAPPSLFVANGRYPSWSRSTPQILPTPTVSPTPVGSPGPTASPTPTLPPLPYKVYLPDVSH
jgi:hypothetical protein